MSMGFDVVAAGKGTKHRDDFRYLTPDQALLEYGMTPEQIESSSLNPRMYNSFLDTTKSSIEMCAVANMTGLVPDVPGMHFPSASVDDIPRLLIPAEDGGILNRQGVVEIVSCLDGEGNDIPGHLRWGVFVVITSRSEYLRRLHEGLRDGDGPDRPLRRHVPALPPYRHGDARFDREGRPSTGRPPERRRGGCVRSSQLPRKTSPPVKSSTARGVIPCTAPSSRLHMPTARDWRPSASVTGPRSCDRSPEAKCLALPTCGCPRAAFAAHLRAVQNAV